MKAKTKTTATKEEATPALVPFLGRCPRLVWRRAFGPVFSANGAFHTSPGQRPGFTSAATFPSPEGATHSPRP